MWLNQDTGEIAKKPHEPGPVPGNYNTDLSQYGDPQFTADDWQKPEAEPKKKQQKKQAIDPFSSAIINAINVFFNEVQNGTVKDAINAAFMALGQSIAQAVAQYVAGAFPSPMGGIIGAVVGGGLGLLVNKLFGKRGVKHEKPSVFAEITNWPDPLKSWTLPSSAYFQPSDSSMPSSIVQKINVTNNITGGPKVAERVVRATTGVGILQAYRRGMQ